MNFDRISRIVLERPGQCMAVMLVLTIVFGAGLYNFSMTMDIDDMLPDTEEVEQLNVIQEEFFNYEMVSFVTKGASVLSPTYFRETADVLEAWLAEDKIRNAMAEAPERSILSVPLTIAQYDLMLEGNLQPSMAQLIERMRSYGSEDEIRTLALAYAGDEFVPQVYRDYLWVMMPTETDRGLDPVPTTGALFVYLDGSLDLSTHEEVELRMEELAKDQTPTVETYLYAEGVLGYYMTQAEMEMEPIFVVLVIVLFIVLLVNFRRASDTGITMASLLLAILWEVGMISWLGFALDFFQFMVPLLLMGLGVDFSLHLLMTYREGLAAEGGQRERVAKAVDKVFKVTAPALLLATVTTMVGFASNMIYDYAAIFKFGLGATLGILAIFLINIFFVLPWRVIKDRRSMKTLEKGAIHVDRIDSRPGPVVRAGVRTLPVAAVLLVVLIAVAVPGLALAPTMEGEYDPRDELLEDQDMTVAATTLMDDFGMGMETLYLRVMDDWTSPGSWQELYAALEELNGSAYLNHVGGSLVAEWIGPFFPAYAMMDPYVGLLWGEVTEDGVTISQRASRENITALLEACYTLFPEVGNFLHKEDGQYASVLVSVSSKTSFGKDGLDLLDDVDGAFEGRFEDYQATGVPIIWGKGFGVMVDYMIQSIIIVVAFALGLLIALYSVRRRDPVLGIISGIPPIIVLGWLFSWMYVSGIPINLLTAMVGAIIIGLGIDYPIHIVNRWVYEADQGHHLRNVYRITLGSTGREIVFSGLTTLLALGTFALIPMEAMRLFGIVMFVAVFFAMMGALVLTPLMLRFWGPKDIPDVREEDVEKKGSGEANKEGKAT